MQRRPERGSRGQQLLISLASALFVSVPRPAIQIGTSATELEGMLQWPPPTFLRRSM